MIVMVEMMQAIAKTKKNLESLLLNDNFLLSVGCKSFYVINDKKNFNITKILKNLLLRLLGT